ncbi:MAG: zeta toxin family protein [Devosia sp.]
MSGEAPKGTPRMVVFAGPNGFGKSTVIDGLKQAEAFPTLYINADDTSRVELSDIADPLARNLKAAQLAGSRRRAAIEDGKSFAFETVMSTPGKLALLDKAKANGFTVDLIFVTTETAAINVMRVENRVAKGGHSVDPEKIRESAQ